jgi:hypothetical protein
MSVSGSEVNLRLPGRESRGSAQARVELIRSARPCGLIWGECKALDGSSFAWWLGWADEIAAVEYLSSSLAAYASGAVPHVGWGQVRPVQ